MTAVVTPPRIDAATTAAGAEQIADAFGLGNELVGEEIWIVDDGDRVLSCRFSGEFSGHLSLAVNASVAERLLSDHHRLLNGFQAALAVVADRLELALQADEVGEEAERPTHIAQIRDNGELCALFGVTFEMAPLDAPDTSPVEDGPTSVEIDMNQLRLLHDVEVEVTVELGRTKMSLSDVLNLRPGMVIELDRSATAPIDMMVNGRQIAYGNVVVIDEEFGIRITELVGPMSIG